MNLSFEDQLLFQCSRVRMGDQALARAADLLQENLDWDYVLEASILHGVAPLFHHGLAQLTSVLDGDAVVPLATKQELQRLYLNNLARNRRLYRVVGEIYQAFEQADIKAIGLKDLPLARTVYPELGLRPIGDVDILIHQEDYTRVEKCMAGLGFTPLPSPDCPYTLKYAWALHFRRPTDNVWVDMQWGVLQLEWDIYGEGNFDFERDRMWRGAQVMPIDDYEILAPRLEDMLFHLCMHLEGHRYAELILFCDIAELIRCYGDELDWNYLVALAKKYRVEASIYYTLLLTQRLLGCPLPVSLQELEPDYFQANLFGPLFGNLTRLHLSLNDVYHTDPPAKVMTQSETAVRRQTVHTMRLFEEIDGLAMALKDLDTGVVILDGTPSQMIFPSQALQMLPNVRLFILDRDLSRLRQALSTCEFKVEQGSEVESYGKDRMFQSTDPATGDAPLVLRLRGQIIDDVGSLLHPGTQQRWSKKDLVFKALIGALNHDENALEVEARIDLVVLSPEDVLLYMAARSGSRRHERLFGLCSLLEFFRSYRGPIDWQQMASAAQRHGVNEPACEGLLMVSALLDGNQVPSSALALLACSDVQPRLLEWARYGPASLDSYTGFKRTFFTLFTFLSIDGLKAKSRYLLRSLLGYQGKKPTLPRLTLEFMTGILSLLHRKQVTARDFAYWTEPELTPKTEPIDK